MLDHVPILLAEDDKNDVFLMKRAFDKAGIGNPLYLVNDGQEVVDYMEGTGKFSDRNKYPIPGLLLLDLKMPLMDGFDVLAWLRTHSQFDTLPVVVLTTSNDYRIKPGAFEDLVRLLDDVRKCWLDERYNRFAGKAGAG